MNNNHTEFSKALLHPKHWGMWLVAGILFVIVHILPYSLLMTLGGKLGKLLPALMPYRVLVAKKNIEQCFPHNAEHIYKKHLDSLGKGIFEMCLGWFKDLRSFQERVDHIGDEHVIKAQSEGKGILFLGMHTTTLVFASPLLTQRYPASPVYLKARNPVLDYIITRARLRTSPIVIEQHNMREVITRLKKGEIIWYGCDQDFGKHSKSVFAPFFGIETYTLAHYVKIAQRTEAVVIPVSGFRDDSTGRFVMRYLPAIDVSKMNELQGAITMNQAIEQLLSGYEEQYYWVHRRFKTRPLGEQRFYPLKPKELKREQRQENVKKDM